MLSRTAEYLYWISRYMERAETTARLLDVGYRMSLFPNPSGYNNEWESVLSAAGAIEGYKNKYDTPRFYFDVNKKHFKSFKKLRFSIKIYQNDEKKKQLVFKK